MNIIGMAIEASSLKSKGKIKFIIKFIIRALLNYPHIKKMNDNFYHGERKALCKNQPDFLTKFLKPYLRTGHSKKEIIEILINHYNWFERKFSADARHQIYNSRLTLHRIDIDDQYYLINLSFHLNPTMEGELTLSLTDSKYKRCYIVSFTVVDNDIYIGCVQGGAHDNGFSRLFTKAIYGLRPKSFMVETLRLLAINLGIRDIYAVKDSRHIYTARRYGLKRRRKTINLNYDRLWEEHNGESHDDFFYKLPINSARKSMEDIKRPKRKMYRERYTWLDGYGQSLKNTLDEYIERHD
ncbi:DUF535 domain-containing protein [Shewanella sp. GutCb]|uniref:VirK/YbjX family protein n=1 Tax=Shewanella sp. GutCb TaxID=2058315 RepID=UPI000C7D615E|nr:VirK/YbjX family protein [Shewanella sp. GutCb]PKG73660.1 DUF535 domain-containing protein [Shewanella sp. GutCb]